jgi:NlpC/P60 family
MAINGNSIGDYASQFLGTPYVWGGNDLKSGVDCSGLIQQVYKHYGIDLPRTTYDMIGVGAPVGIKGLRPGDLVFFDTDKDKPGPDHVGIYLGGGKMVEAPKPGGKVQITDMTQKWYVDRFMGGRRISGVHATGAKESDYEPTQKLSPEELAANYGWALGFMNSIPEVKSKFDQAVKESWTTDKFKAELRDTKWWKENAQSRREAQVIQKTDPATWNAQLNASIIKVKQLAAEIGAAVPDSKLSSIAKNLIETGAINDEDLMRNALAGYVDFTKKGTLKGEAGMHEYTMRQFAYANGVQISDSAIKNQAQLVVKKLAKTEDFENQIRQQAISMFPAYKTQIEAGATVKDIASPYMQMMSDELETPFQGIDVVDPTIKAALNGVDQKGKPQGLSLTDFQQVLRNDPRWKETAKAQNSTMTVGAQVLRDMGLVGSSGQ